MSERYFPVVSPATERLELRLRKLAAPMKEAGRRRLYGLFAALHPGLTRFRMRPAPPLIEVRQKGRRIMFPAPLPLIKYSHISYGYEKHLWRKYTLPGFVEVAPGDVVIDCGAYVGGFSLRAARIARAVHLFEPDALNAAAARANFADMDHVRVNEAGLFSSDGEMTLNIAGSSVEHSFLAPDDGEAIATRTVPVLRIDSYCTEHAPAGPDFVKIEAEGVEIEVFEGLGALRPAKIAIDVSPERDGESPAARLAAMLKERGYETRQRLHVLFARRL